MIITSLLDNDLYKFSMMQAVFHQFPNVNVEYTFKCRTDNFELSPYIPEILNEVRQLCSISLNSDELEYLESLDLFKKDYLKFLRTFKLNNGNVYITKDSLKIVGKWVDTILFETPLLAIIEEIYCKHNYKFPLSSNLLDRIGGGIHIIKNSNLKFADFGTRRRFSKEWHDTVIWYLVNKLKNNFTGTSNVMLAKKYDVKPIGTMAHEWLQAGQGLTELEYSQKYMLEKWLDEYPNNLKIALTDVITMDSFLKDFDKNLAVAYDGCRQDSGDPYIWCNKLINHYKSFGINPKTKAVIFSDGLDFNKAMSLYIEFKDKINVAFGIGTKITNNIGITPLNIVIKMTKCNGLPVAKISDSQGKTVCEDLEYINKLKTVFEI